MCSLLCSAIGLLSVPSSTSAHHSTAGFFDRNSLVEIEGIVARIQWRNPHTVFEIDVQNQSGETVRWRVESGALGVLRAQGLSSDFIGEGDRVSILGDESLRGLPEMFARNILLASGEEILLTLGARPYFSEQDAAVTRASGSFDDGIAAEARANADGIFRVWSSIPQDLVRVPGNSVFTGQQIAAFPYTARGRQIRDEWDPGAEFILGCTEWTMPRLMNNPLPFEFVRQGQDIVIDFEEDDNQRVVHMNAAMPAAVQPSRMGYSTGYWEGESLVVNTRFINESSYEFPVSLEAEVREVFTPNAEGTELHYEVRHTDPVMLTEPVRHERYWFWRPEIRVERYACEEEQLIE
ncbi:MAG: DUF6152 family protein [Rubricoccaceae bacterium]|nr:DUF6152 family protein [Rubricoccaceae bacterium]